MNNTVVITGTSTGIGRACTLHLDRLGFNVYAGVRRSEDAKALQKETSERLKPIIMDVSDIGSIKNAAEQIKSKNGGRIDGLINNAGVYSTAEPITRDGIDIRFAVNTLAPYLLTKRLLPLLPDDGRVINLSSAAQSPVSLEALAGRKRLNDSQAYAQSKLAQMMFAYELQRRVQAAGKNTTVQAFKVTLQAGKWIFKTPFALLIIFCLNSSSFQI